MTGNTTYNFEKKGSSESLRTRQKAEEELEKFAVRVDFNDIDYSKHKDVLLDYIIQHHLNIEWYTKRRKKERCLRVFFTAITLLLLLGIPFALYFIYKLAGDTEILTAQITAILTGLLAVHKALSSWLDKRKLIGNFWKASADLKENLYSFEDKYKGKAVTEGNELSQEFLEDINNGIKQARQIVKEEQKAFFEGYSLPSVDLTQRLKEAFTGAKDLLKAQPSPQMDRKTAREEEEKKIAKLEAKIKHLDKLIEEKKELIKNSDETEKTKRQERIKDLEDKREQAQDELIDAKAELDSLS